MLLIMDERQFTPSSSDLGFMLDYCAR